MSIRKKLLILLPLVSSLILCLNTSCVKGASEDDKYISYIADPKEDNIDLYWKDDKGDIISTIRNLRTYLENKDKELIFAMNGGMFDSLYYPQGLLIQDGVTKKGLDTTSGYGNFYLMPNGVFYMTNDGSAEICSSEKFVDNGQIRFATQSGPMLLIDGNIHPAFNETSSNVHIRNGVGILPDNKIVFAISKEKVNFYDFATYFKSLGCQNALYLDGYVSRMYFPEENRNQLDGKLGVIIGITE